MEVIILEDSNAVAQLGAQRIVELIEKKPNAVLGLATGSTPISMYQQLIQLHRQEQVNFGRVTTFNLDEYIGINSDNPQSYHSFMRRELFDAIDISLINTHLPACKQSDNPRQMGAAYEASIVEAGGIDLQVLGIGSNGHIGFNEPTSSLSSRTRVKTLSPTTVKDNSRLFDEGEFQPYLAMTMGIGTILDARRVLLLAVGKEKATAVCDAVEGPLTAMCPASALQLHERATLIVDKAAASTLKNAEYYHWVYAQNEPLEALYGHFYELDSLS